MAAGPSTMMEALSKTVDSISQAMTTPDADIPFLTSLQGVVVGRMRQGMGGGSAQSSGMGQPPGQQGGMSPSPAGQPPGGAPQGPSPGPGGPGQLQGQPTPMGVQPLAQAPNPDELRRMLAQKVGA